MIHKCFGQSSLDRRVVHGVASFPACWQRCPPARGSRALAEIADVERLWGSERVIGGATPWRRYLRVS